ncbi:type I restriction-modification system subunit M [Mycoplasma sp. Sp48II]|uniref:type I restriction-modification system subunit M n=1 Tax=Mycoplasma sp. Sp48II TaxID=3401682 RepID=UPI003AB103B4
MNKQELANRIWASANNMRSKIEANEYKDYILGFIFYKFLSEQEEKYLISKYNWSKEDLKYLGENKYDLSLINNKEELETLSEDDQAMIETIVDIQSTLGYYIQYDDLFSTWLKMGKDFGIDTVHRGLARFNSNIGPKHKKVFNKIFNTLETGLSKLGDSTGAQTKEIASIINIIKDIPMDDKQDYDVLGFIYEYLISMFAANAGKKAGEFYTPHEVSVLMAEIVSHVLRKKETISIYDPTSGSGSLLINIGKSMSKYIDKSNIKYYAQELKDSTYNLTRMNLIMRGILPNNIETRNGDTLKEDWPYFDENKVYERLYLDAVVSNPPYSQPWDPEMMENDPRFAEYGIAPKSKADYAFLLHDLYHLKSDGVLTIVLPHGVLFRGGEEERIRRNLIEKNNIDAIIGLPANIFFGTGIPTIVMVLRKDRVNDDVLFIDASKNFIKDGKNNRLQSSDIKKIVDTYVARANVDKFSRKVSREEIRQNDFNLNIPRYVDSNAKAESWDIYASMFGGVPNIELEAFNDLWSAFPTLKAELFAPINDKYSELKNKDIYQDIFANSEVKAYEQDFKDSLSSFEAFLKKELIDGMMQVNIHQEEDIISNHLAASLQNKKLVDFYQAYQLMDDEWKVVSNDLEVIQAEGFDVIKAIKPKMVSKKDKNNNPIEVQDGYMGYILPFELIQEVKLQDLKQQQAALEQKVQDIDARIEELTGEITEEDKETYSNLFAEDTGKLIDKEVKSVLKEFSKVASNDPEGFEAKIVEISTLGVEKKEVAKQSKALAEELVKQTIAIYDTLSDADARELITIKWVTPVIKSLESLPTTILETYADNLKKLGEKYQNTLMDIENDIREVSNTLISLIDELDANEEDKKGLEEFKKLLSMN